jgi:glycosyltransferase involved in cell wall biosynthesis
MRILIVHSRYLSGPASGENAVVEDEARLLAANGHRVEVLQRSPTRTSGTDLLRTGIGATWERDAVSRLQGLIREMQPNIVHFHNLFPMISPAALRVSAKSRAATVMTLHNYRMMCLPATFLRDGRICEDCLGRSPWPGVVHRCYRGSLPGSAAVAISLSVHQALRTFDRVTLYLPVSDFVRSKYVQAGFPPERLHVKSNFAWPVTRREGPGHHFVYVGRISPEKGLRTLIEAWGKMTAKLVIVGDGPAASDLRTSARNVEFTGMLPRARVVELVREARALLLPSLWYEAQPRVVLEAYAAGVPVVGSDIGGIPDLIVEGETGFLVSPTQPGAWTEAANRLLDDAETSRLGEGAHRVWLGRFSPERALQALEDSYRTAISRRDRQGGIDLDD